MGRSLRTIITTLAIANMLALAGFVGWLKMSDRLDMDRLEQVRSLFAETRAQQQAREAKEAQEAKQAEADAQVERDRQKSPVAAVGRLQLAAEVSELVHEDVERARKETESLRRALAIERANIDAERKKFLARKKAFEDMRAQIEIAGRDSQFKKTVGLYESIKPAQAKDMLRALLDQGQEAQVVAYLNAMASRAASNIMKQFKDDPALAAGLLERLRKFGLDAQLAEGK